MREAVVKAMLALAAIGGQARKPRDLVLRESFYRVATNSGGHRSRSRVSASIA